ncbi:MAG TPA: MFS transporter, partial [Dehalococcoidia bacterium]|nr:MFS transporter [Dehalococcoidia bacterium]
VTLVLAMFTATMGIGIVAPVLPVHARSLGATGPQIALTFSAFAITQILISPFAGRLGDRYGRKPFILIGLSTYLIAAVGWLLTTDIWVAISLRALSGIGSALVFSLSSAYIGDLTPSGSEGRYMGVYGLFDFLGFGLGPLISGVVRDRYGFDAVFIVMAGLLVVSMVVIAILLPGVLRSRDRPSSEGDSGLASARARDPAPWGVILRHPLVQGLFAVGLGYSIAFGAGFSFLAIYLEGEIRATATMVGFVLAGQEFTAGLLQPLFGRFADIVSRRLMILGGTVMVATGYATFALTNEYAVLVVAFALGAGVGSAIQGVASRAVAVEVGRGLGMATVMSLNSMSFGVGVMVGSLGGGVIADAFDTRAVFVAASASLFVSALVFQQRTAGRRLRGVEQPREASAAGA